MEKWKTHIGIFVAYVSCRDEVSDECANFATVVTHSSNTMMMNSLIDFVFEKKLSRFYMTWFVCRGSPLTTMQRLLVTLRFLATGSMQRVVGDIFGVTVSTACCTINKTVRVLASLKGRILNFPDENTERDIMTGFFQYSGFPGCIGAIDCTHIRIECPDAENACLFVNRKGFYSINVQAVCDSKAVYSNIVARWPGSTHDQRIFDNSRLSDLLRDRGWRGHLVGDDGYALRPYMMIPFSDPQTQAEIRYNTAQRLARNVIERSFGMLKRRFACLQYTLRNDLKNILPIITACFVLHNFAKLHNEPEVDDDYEEPADEAAVPVQPQGVNAGGMARRRAIVMQYFL